MKMDEHARAWAHEYVAGLLGSTALPPEQRTSLHWEILNHVHEAAEARAVGRGGAVVTLADVQAAATGLGGHEGLVDAFHLETRVAATPRADFGRRVGAFLVDLAILFPVAFLYGYIMDTTFSMVFPYGHRYDRSYYAFLDMVYTTLVFFGFVLALAYLAVMEFRFGATPGKMAFKLRTVGADGSAITLRAAVIRNVAKVFPPFLVLDVLLYLVVFRLDNQRASDRIANTIVIDGTKAVWQSHPLPLPTPVARVYGSEARPPRSEATEPSDER